MSGNYTDVSLKGNAKINEVFWEKDDLTLFVILKRIHF